MYNCAVHGQRETAMVSDGWLVCDAPEDAHEVVYSDGTTEWWDGNCGREVTQTQENAAE